MWSRWAHRRAEPRKANFYVWIKRRYKNKPRWGKPSWFPATMKILTLDIYIMSEEFLSPWFHECGSDHIQGVRVKMSTVIWMELTEAGCLTSTPVCFLCLSLPDSLLPQLQLWSGVWCTELTDTVGTDHWEMKILHKQHRCTYTTHKSTYRNYVMMYSQFNWDFRNIPFCSGMLAWRAGEGAQSCWLKISLSEPYWCLEY